MLAVAQPAAVNPPKLAEVTPPAAGFNSATLDQIPALVEAAIARHEIPGAVVAIGRRDQLVWLRAFGHRQVEPTPEAMTTDTIFDLASLTKPLVTSALVMQLVETKQWSLTDPVSKHWPEFAQADKATITLEQLLTHTGGLIADNALRDYQGTRAQQIERLLQTKPVAAPGERFIYSDVGFICLGLAIEQVTKQPLDQVALEKLFAPLGMQQTCYNPPRDWQAMIAPTEKHDGKFLRGRVHDPRAAAMNGVAGHAGLFSTARDLALYANWLLSDPGISKQPLITSQTMQTWLQPRAIPLTTTQAKSVANGKETRALGWDQNSPYSSNKGSKLSPTAIGHGGFTGTSFWVDREQNLFVIVLSNRLHPTGQGSVNVLAGKIADLAVTAIEK